MNTYIIEVECIDPPIPVRAYDYRATFKGEEEPAGYGDTECSAIQALLEQFQLQGFIK